MKNTKETINQKTEQLEGTGVRKPDKQKLKVY
jgi:hypothetical protein